MAHVEFRVYAGGLGTRKSKHIPLGGETSTIWGDVNGISLSICLRMLLFRIYPARSQVDTS